MVVCWTEGRNRNKQTPHNYVGLPVGELEEVISEDTKAAFAAFKDDSFDTTNVLANRVMSNCIFGDNSKDFLAGFFIKDVAFHFGLLKARSSSIAFSTAKSHGFSFIERISKSLPVKDEKVLWESFLAYKEKIRTYESTDWENKNYSINKKFTAETFAWLLKYLDENKKWLYDPRNFLIKGIINEMNRIYRVHSADLKDFTSIYLMIALDRNYDYICRVWNRPDLRLIDEEKVKELIIPAVEKIIDVTSQELSIENTDKLLWDLVKNWRKFFIIYGELLSPTVALQKGIEIPEELKKKLTESVTKSLENEM